MTQDSKGSPAQKTVSITEFKKGAMEGSGNGNWAQPVHDSDEYDEYSEPYSPAPRKSFAKRMSELTKSQKATDISKMTQGKTVFQQCNAVSRAEVIWREKHIANSVTFNTFIGVVISVNAILIGLETDQGSGEKLEDRMFWFFAECIFCIIFFAEMLVRQNLDGWRYFLDPWNLLDYHLVVLGFVDICMSVFASQGGEMRVFTAFRIIRMLRLVRNIRLLRMFREIWILVKGMYDVMPTLGWISILLILATYCGSVYVVMGVGKDPKTNEMWFDSEPYVGSIFKGMYSLFQVITFDNWSEGFVRPLVALRADMVLVLSLLIVWCSFGILNVIVGVIVERTLCVAQDNEDNVMKKIEECELALISQIALEFVKADTSSDDQLSNEEFKEALNEPRLKNKLALLDIPHHEVEEIFYILDTDHSGTISCEEFVHGLQRIKGQAQGKELVMLCSCVNRAIRRVEALKNRTTRLNRTADQVLGRLDSMWQLTNNELQKRDEAMDRQEILSQKSLDKQKVLGRLDRHTSLKFPRLGTPMQNGQDRGPANRRASRRESDGYNEDEFQPRSSFVEE